MFTHTNQISPIDLDSSIQFGKRWYTTPSGIQYPSVTTILGQKEKPQLESWRRSLGPKLADKKTKSAAERGIKLHEAVERYLKNENPGPTLELSTKKLLNQMAMHLRKIDNIVAQEIALYSDTLKIAGRVDCIANFDGTIAVIDFKTSSNNKKDEFINDYRLQTTAYALMFEEMYNIPIDNIVILIAVENGMVALKYVDTIDKYIKPLLERINDFYRVNGAKNG